MKTFEIRISWWENRLNEDELGYGVTKSTSKEIQAKNKEEALKIYNNTYTSVEELNRTGKHKPYKLTIIEV